ncbi:MAG TPA: CBS domain-containing protein [Thermoplasmata archaeon]|nr:CBS domain-containing protein [Thermoplasmata archaeon]
MPAAWPTANDLMSKRPATLPHDAPVSRALGLMRSRGYHEVPVLRKSHLIGMITVESIARRVRRALETKVEHLLILPPLVTPATTYPEIAEMLLAAGLRAAPVVGRRGELLGIVSRSDLVRELGRVPLFDKGRLPAVEEVSRPPSLTVRENDLCRNLVDQIRLLEEHPFPVVDRKGRLVGAVGVKDLTEVLWRPTVGGKRDARAVSTALNVEVGSIMHRPAVTVPNGTDAIAAARRMTEENVSSVFVVEDGRPTRVLSESDLLGLIVARSRPAQGRPRVEDVYVEITGLRGAGDPALIAEIDQLVARGLARITRYSHPSLLSLHFAPHATHRTNDLTVEARLHTDDGIFYATHTGWNLMAGVSGLLEDLAGQTHRVHEAARQRARRRGRSDVEEESSIDDPDLEQKIRAATGDDGA